MTLNIFCPSNGMGDGMGPTEFYLNQFISRYHYIYRDLSFEDKKWGRTYAFSLESSVEYLSPDVLKDDKYPPRVVIFFHGTGNDSIFPHLGLFHELLRQNYKVVSFDLPGHGATSTTLLTKQGTIEFIQQVVARFRSLYQEALFFGIGYSLGGDYLIRHTALCGGFKALALVATPHDLELNFKAAIFESVSLMIKDLYAHRRYYGLGGLFPAVGPFGRRTFPIRLGDAGPYWKVVGGIIRDCALKESLDRVSIEMLPSRTLLIYAQWDRIAPPMTLADLLGDPFRDELSRKISAVVIPHQTHYSLLFYRHLASLIMDDFRRALTGDL